MTKTTAYLTCRNCGGKGHVLDGVFTVFSFVGLVLAPFERNDPRGMTRQQCVRCNGKGYETWPTQ